MRKVWFAFYLLATVAGLFFVIEFGLRFFDFVPNSFFLPRYYAGVHGDLEPGMRITDSLYPQLLYRITATQQGTRGLVPFTAKKPEGTLRVLCVGDSFTFGYGVDDEDTYPELLRQELGRRFPGRSIEIVNAGVPMFGILDEMDYFLQKGAALNPDVVVLQFFLNDLQDICREVVIREMFSNDPTYSRRSGISKLLSGSRLYQLAVSVRLAFTKTTQFTQPVSRSARETARFNPGLDPYRFKASKETVDFFGSHERIAGGDPSGPAAPAWEAYLEALKGFRDMTRHFGADMLFLCVPDLVQVEGRAYTVNQVLSPALERLGIPAVDMLASFRTARFLTGVHPYLVPRDGHCSPYGNQLIARAVADSLVLAESSEKKSLLRVAPRPRMSSFAGPLEAEVLADPQAIFTLAPGARLIGRLERVSGLTVEKEGSFPINAVKLEDEAAGEGEAEFSFVAPEPLSSVELRLPGYAGEDPARRSKLEAYFSLDGKVWQPLLCKASTGSQRQGTYESYFLLDLPFKDIAPTSFRILVRMSGTSRLCTERMDGQKRERRMMVTGFPAGR
ncbi:MAG: SGNH/GDSL hydrolase family protein [Desulfovibrio sp.]|nr:SGNH/GDSL hydrolase family protein [Desulfovibrio sp.]MBI4961590.1 SGNH/GDSL hydrolase family protein [Desulfovibrio sp.]